MNAIDIPGLHTEQETLEGFPIVVIKNNSFRLKTILTLDLTVLRSGSFKTVKEYFVRITGSTCIGSRISIDYTGEVARTIFYQLK